MSMPKPLVFDTLVDGLDLDDPDGSREFLARVFRQRLERQDYTRYIISGLAGDFSRKLAAYMAPMIQADDAAKAAGEVVSVEDLQMVPFQVGNFYKTLDGRTVRFVAVNRQGCSSETMVDESGVHRYTSRDFGRVTGSSHEEPYPLNVLPLYHLPALGSRGSSKELQLAHARDEIASLKAQLAEAQADGLERSAAILRDLEATDWQGSKGHHTGLIHAARHLEVLGKQLREVESSAQQPALQEQTTQSLQDA